MLTINNDDRKLLTQDPRFAMSIYLQATRQASERPILLIWLVKKKRYNGSFMLLLLMLWLLSLLIPSVHCYYDYVDCLVLILYFSDHPSVNFSLSVVLLYFAKLSI